MKDTQHKRRNKAATSDLMRKGGAHPRKDKPSRAKLKRDLRKWDYKGD